MNLWLQRGGWREGIGRELGMKYTLLYFKQITNKDLLYSTRSSAQCYMAAWMRGEFGGKMDTYISMAGSLRCPSETITTLLTGYTPIQRKKCCFFFFNPNLLCFLNIPLTVKVLAASSCLTLCNSPVACQAPLSMEFSR